MELEEKQEAIEYFRQAKQTNAVGFLYVSPESLLTEAFYGHFGPDCFNSMDIDEVHCVSTWGNSFRPDYMRLGAAAERLGVSHAGGFTATITPKIVSDIYRYTPLKKENCVMVRGDPVRPNIKLKTVFTDKFEGTPVVIANQKRSALLKLTRSQKTGAVIVYCSSRAACERLYDHHIVRGKLLRQGYTTYLYHAHVDAEMKAATLAGFANDERPLVFATNAFGMGIDRADVHQVIHYNNPTSLLGYAQEYGRAGRDGEAAVCTTFFDRTKIEETIRRRAVSIPNIKMVEGAYESIVKMYRKQSAAAKAGFSTSKYLRRMQKVVANDDTLTSFERQMRLDRLSASISFLKQVQLIREDVGMPIKFFKLKPGSSPHVKLIELTRMQERSEAEQLRLVGEFFAGGKLTQERVWKLMGA